jgi:hypothetical protein
MIERTITSNTNHVCNARDLQNKKGCWLAWVAEVDNFYADLIQQLGELLSVDGRAAKQAQLMVR